MSMNSVSSMCNDRIKSTHSTTCTSYTSRIGDIEEMDQPVGLFSKIGTISGSSVEILGSVETFCGL